MYRKRDVLALLTKPKLIEISVNYGYKGWSVLSKSELVNLLVRKRSIPLESLLSLFKINELRLAGALMMQTSYLFWLS